MLKRFIPAAVVAASLAGLAFASPASAATLPDRIGSCPRGYFCLYTTDGQMIVTGDEDWGPVSPANSQYKNVRSFFNNGVVATYDHVLVSYVYSSGAAYSKCVHPAEDGDPTAGHETVDSPVTVTRIQWRRENCAA
ncbi:peptidase inhibitor family I36 protein [Nonomuraea sp. NPDC005983]|uniref:peptidase inhibitor family I36 protein n=1 Tax=Nonomuraea sp. NPDC005983 TaxID=3155595 RepID=UPI0033B5938F